MSGNNTKTSDSSLARMHLARSSPPAAAPVVVSGVYSAAKLSITRPQAYPVPSRADIDDIAALGSLPVPSSAPGLPGDAYDPPASAALAQDELDELAAHIHVVAPALDAKLTVEPYSQPGQSRALLDARGVTATVDDAGVAFPFPADAAAADPLPLAFRLPPARVPHSKINAAAPRAGCWDVPASVLSQLQAATAAHVDAVAAAANPNSSRSKRDRRARDDHRDDRNAAGDRDRDDRDRDAAADADPRRGPRSKRERRRF
ncbi:uncharacterized protein AMSG_10916 [Thecamonas trahens ATCC 50062]|uniref:Uncharacterized protein n=1 Tax=Thecamonas trahens ATCC 50062 TaxID=461836 RepID=A0A0L0DST1_THETB|nr:hypothetical protein AMSG_10916 [Thecamonas trahens ATCC 50062]KNC55277.1 hypothetical protein AMSG_10916 [Thecamonas trahens ATCC 50062]|eukprot:XP_013753100.1 hypothetical protein AMSG_10916 [Thecamonas trahens ATCC 50062]